LGQYKTAEESYEFYRPYSEQTADKIDAKIKSIIAMCYDKAKDILRENTHLLKALSTVLLEKEYLTKDEFQDLMADSSKAEGMIEAYRTQEAKTANIIPSDDIEVIIEKEHNKKNNNKKH